MLRSTFGRLKRRLQFSDWLQYILNAVLALTFLAVAPVPLLLGHAQVAYPFLVAGALVLMALAFDIVTVKLHLHPVELIPSRNDHLDQFDLMRARRSCRSFQSRSMTPAHRHELMRSVGRHIESPMLGHSAIRFEYVCAPIAVWPVVGAYEFLVAVVPAEYDRLAVLDVGRILQMVVIDATRAGLATCWIGAGADWSSVHKHLGERFSPERDHVVCVCAIGYASWYTPFFVRLVTARNHRRLPLSSLFFADSDFAKPLDVETRPFNRFGRNYEVCQWSPSSFNAQTTRCVAVLEEEGLDEVEDSQGESRLVRFDFYAVTDSRYYAPLNLGIWLANWEMGCGALGIRGHFAQRSTGEKDTPQDRDPARLPRYDMSWVPDEHV